MLEKLKKKLGKQVLDYDRTLNNIGGDGGERITVYVSSTLQRKIHEVLDTINELKKLELAVNGEIPKGLRAGEKEFRAKLEYLV
jgi:hypothetical protein